MSESDSDEVSPKKGSKKIQDSSSSESDIENYLQRPEDLNLNSTFFKLNKTPLAIKRKLEQSRGALSDSDSDDPLSIYTNKDEPVASTSTSKTPEKLDKCDVPVQEVFKDQNKHALDLEEAKRQVEAYIARRKVEKSNNTDEVDDLLSQGEKPFDLAKDLAEVGFHPSDFESDNESEKGDWEEVEESQEKNIIPKEGVEITVSMPNTMKKKKGIDLMAALKRRMNRIKKEQQVYVHKVHLLCWIAHGNYVNNVLNKESVMAMALSLLPTKDCYPPARTNLKYLEQITKWYHKAMKYKPEPDEKFGGNLEETLVEKMGDKVATSANVLVYIFVSMLRALGMQCRIVLSLQVEPLRPPASELCSLKNESKVDKNNDVKGAGKTKNEDDVKKTKQKTSHGVFGKGKDKSKNDKSKSQTKKSPDIKESKKITEKKITPISKSSNSNDQKVEKPNLSKLVQKSTVDIKSPEKTRRQTRSRTSNPKVDVNIVDDDDSDFKKPPSSSKLIPKPLTTSKSTRSKSASTATKTKDSLDVPITKSTSKRSKSATTEKPKVLSSIDAKVAALEALESTKPNLKKLSVTSLSTSDDDEFDRGSWRRKSKSPQVAKQRASLGTIASPEKNPALLNSMFQSDDDKPKPKNKNKIKVRVPTKRSVPQLDGHMDDSISSSEDDGMVYQLDGADDKPSKPKLKALKDDKTRLVRLKQLPKALSQPEVNSQKTPPITNINLNRIKSPTKSISSSSNLSQSRSSSTSSYFTPDKIDVKDVIVSLVKKSVREDKIREKMKTREKTTRKSYNYDDSDSDSDFAPEPSPKKRKTPEGKVKKRVLPRSQLEALAKEKAEAAKKKVKGIDLWVEVFLEEEEKWISADVVSGKVHCIKDLCSKASHPISYVLAWDNVSKVKDVTKRYCPNWNTVTRKLRIEPEWWNASLKSYIGTKTARDKEEDEDLARLQLDQPLPKTISEYKDHPLYVLKRHLLKFQALYPPDPPILGFIRKEEVYSRDCVYTLHSREIWLKHAKTVKPGEEPYKIVKARPKYDKLSNSMITDQLLEIFGVWQVQDYDPPTAENGVVPRNAYGNIELFKPCMLPKKCVHLQLPGLKKVAAKLQIDCAPAVTGFDFHGGWNHAIYDGFIVCEEFKDVLIAAWEQEQEEITKREQEKYEKRVFGNWRRLIKAAFIRRRLKLRYDFTDKVPTIPTLDVSISPEPPKEKDVSPSKPKRPKFMSRK